MKRIFEIIILTCLIQITAVQASARPIVTTGLITWRTKKADFGQKFLVDGQWTYIHDKGNPISCSTIIGQIQDAGVDAIYHDMTNWGSAKIHEHGNNVWAACADELPVVSAEVTRRGMKQFVMMRAQSTTDGKASNYYTSIDRANWQAEKIWNGYAQKDNYLKVDGKPAIKIFEPKHDEFWAAYKAAPASEKTYMSKFTFLTEATVAGNRRYTGALPLGVNGTMNATKYREVYPHHQNIEGPWLTYREKDTGAQWANKVKWAMGASQICDLGWYDESSDGSAWAIADATDAINGTCAKPRLCNKYPSNDWWIYYKTVQSYCAKTLK